MIVMGISVKRQGIMESQNNGPSRLIFAMSNMQLSLPVMHFILRFTVSSPSLMILSAAVRTHQSSDRHGKEHRSFLAAEIL